MTKTKSNIWKLLRTVVGFTVAFFLIRFVVVSTGLDLRKLWATVEHKFLVVTIFFYGASFFAAAYRWYLLLHHIKVKLALAVVIRLALIGQFFNLFVPGGVGGDLIKLFYLKKESGDRFPEAVLTVLLDRVLGLTGLLLLALMGIGLNPSVLNNPAPEMQAIVAVVSFAASCGVLGALGFFLWPYLQKHGARFSGLAKKIPAKVLAILERVLAAVSLIRATPSVVVGLLVLAMLGHLFATCGVFFIGKGVGGAEQVSFLSILLATQLSNLVAAVPLTPGGLGGRDLILSFLLQLSGATEHAQGAIPLVVTTVLICWSLVGGLALLWERRAGEMPVTEPGDDEA